MSTSLFYSAILWGLEASNPIHPSTASNLPLMIEPLEAGNFQKIQVTSNTQIKPHCHFALLSGFKVFRQFT